VRSRQLAGGLVPGQAVQHQGAADPVATQASRLLPLLDSDRRVHREAAVAPGEEALDHLVADLAALDEEPEHFGPEELLDLRGVEVEEVTKAAVGEPTAVGEQHVQVGMPA